MIFHESQVLILSTIISFASLLYFLPSIKKNPFTGTHLLLFTLIGFTVELCLYLISAIGHESEGIDLLLATNFHRLGFFLGLISAGFLFTALIIPDFKNNSFEIGLLITGNVFLVNAGFANAMTLTDNRMNDKIIFNYHPVGLIITLFAIILFIFVIRRRTRKVKLVVDTYENIRIPYNNYSKIFSILLILITITLLLPRFSDLPSYSFSIPLSLIIFFISFTFVKQPGFWFLTPVSLSGIAVTDKAGVELYTKNFDHSSSGIELMGTFLSSVNSAMKQILSSNHNLEKLTYRDKIVLFKENKNTTLFLIVSTDNLIINEIGHHLSKQFEKLYISVREKGKLESYNKLQFESFDKNIDGIRAYIPL